MELMRSRWGICMILFLSLQIVTEVSGKRPEIILAEVLAKPFVPREFASLECIRDSKIYLEELEKYTPWALQMYDASVKIPSGVITGNYKQLGNFDECLLVKNEHGFVGQACNAAVQFEITADDGASERELDLSDLLLNVAIASNATKWTSGNTVDYTWMWCVPSTCNYTEIQEALELEFDSLKVEGRVDMIVSVPKESCHTIESVNSSWDHADVCYIVILAFIAFLVIASTVYDITGLYRNITSKWKVIFTSFSLYTNGKNLLRTDRQREAISCLDGMRFISICWIIYGHTYYLEAVGVKMNLTQIVRMHHDWNSMLVLNGNIVTDTFFLLSSTLLSYNVLLKKERASNSCFDFIGLYIHRYIRVTPAYAMMIGFYATLFYKIGMGPNWDAWVGSNKNFCRENWYTNLLYVNNFVNVPNMCMSQSWYLSTDMQLVWLSPLVLYPMLKFRSLYFNIILFTCFLLSILVPFAITFIHQLTGTMLYYKDQMNVSQVYLEIYTKVYNRFGPYVIGLGLGYVLYKTQSKVKLRVSHVICGWLIAILIGCSAIFGPRAMYFEDHEYNRLEASFYAGFHRQTFALSVSWIIFCCVNGYAGPVNHFLSWCGWLPLSKLSYCAYLCHYVFLLSDIGTARTTGNLTSINVLRAFFANLMFTMILSAIWSLCFEMPFTNIDRILLSGRKSSKQRNFRHTTDSDKEISQSRNELSTTYNNDNNSEKDMVYCDSTETADENRENSVEHEEAKKNISKIYLINPIKCDDAQDMNTHKRKSGYVNVDFYRTFDERSRMSSSGKLSINIESADIIKPSHFSKNRKISI
ncbi:nose resistant to fluoxetine protein 6-like isoform X1 [Cataglyphis hispanica]|uniref:nose resistant to fluoxetine protein 6-like isoform X1 n=2 Tax=Cataglyphis hispanica TaxID=1086592 RepID=UPI0021806814|nr:nose resistant to fluoxetine protein 6-like isoform X1 [Cataglyphis hispanica]